MALLVKTNTKKIKYLKKNIEPKSFNKMLNYMVKEN